MVQLISITKARSNLSSLVTQVAQTKQPVLVLRGNTPIVEIHPHHEIKDNLSKNLLSIKGSWDLRKEVKQVRKEVEERIKKIHNE